MEPNKPGFCPECGSNDLEWCEGRRWGCCACGQEQYTDIDYTEVIRKHLSGQYNDKDNRIATLEQRIRDKDYTESQLRHECIALEGKLGAANARVAELEAERDNLIRAVADHVTVRGEKQDRIAELEHTRDVLHDSYIDHLARIQMLEVQLAASQAQNTALVVENSQLRDAINGETK